MKRRPKPAPTPAKPFVLSKIASTSNDAHSETTGNVEQDERMKLSRRIAMAGIASRRAADVLIREGKVELNGAIVRDVTTRVTHDDVISANGTRISSLLPGLKLWIVHKLPGELVTNHDPKGRPTIMRRLANMGLPPHLMAIGRLDFNTEGLLLLTNNGEYARKLELPESGIQRVYHALVRGEPAEWKFQHLARGITTTVDTSPQRRVESKSKFQTPEAKETDGPPVVRKKKSVTYQPIQVQVLSKKGKDVWLEVRLREGKKREVRNALAHCKFVVKRLIRTEFGHYQLGKLTKGSVMQVTKKKQFYLK